LTNSSKPYSLDLFLNILSEQVYQAHLLPMSIKGVLTLLFLSILSLRSEAAAYFEMTPLIEKAYEKVINLRFQEAEALLEQIKQAESDNLLVYHIENYIDFFKVFIGENKAEFKRLEKNKTKRLNAIKKGDKNSPYYYYTQAEIKLQWALARVKFEEYFNAFNEVSSAYDLNIPKTTILFSKKRLSSCMLSFYYILTIKVKKLGELYKIVDSIPKQIH